MNTFNVNNIQASSVEDLCNNPRSFIKRHLGTNTKEQIYMLKSIGYNDKETIQLKSAAGEKNLTHRLKYMKNGLSKARPK